MDRRSFLSASATFAAWSLLPQISSAAGASDPRFLTIILRGALDGLAAVAPTGDPLFTDLRPDESDAQSMLPLDGFFALNPALKNMKTMFEANEMLAVHAIATPYRGRSHFDGQDVLESGYSRHKRADSGWLNRALTALQGREMVKVADGLAVGPTVPLILKGPAPVTAWGPESRPNVSEDTIARLRALYHDDDPTLLGVLEAGIRTDLIIRDDIGLEESSEMLFVRRKRGNLTSVFERAARGAGRLMSSPEGPRIGALSYDGWDTHSNDGILQGRLFRQLSALDHAVGVLRTEMEAVWDQTVIAIVTEFGRTAAENGSSGTDHGTGSAMFLIGGAVKGGRVIADWPGLAPNDLYEGRDLKPTTDMRSILWSILSDHVGLEGNTLGIVFPDTPDLVPVSGLVG